MYPKNLPQTRFSTQIFNQRDQTDQNTSKYIAKNNQNIQSNFSEFEDNPPKIPQFWVVNGTH